MKIKRKFSVGSEWLYYKISCGPTFTEKILLRKLNAVLQKSDDKITKWFYIRYIDEGGYHLRFGIQLNNIKDNSSFLREINKELEASLESRLISNIQIDTYIREVERYGELTMESSESLFYFDSACVIEITELLDGHKGETYRWFYGLLSINFLLNDFNFSLGHKIILLNRMKKSFAIEFEVNKYSRKQMSKIYIKNKLMILFGITFFNKSDYFANYNNRNRK